MPDSKMVARDDVPYRTDEWILKVKRELSSRYHVGKTYLVGKGDGAHYAAYLGTKYPEDFAGVGMIEGSWVGAFEKLLVISGRPRKQIPLFVSLHGPDEESFKQTQKWAYQFSSKGYSVYLEKFEKNETVDIADLKMRMMDWLQKKTEEWAQAIAKSGKTKKEKVRQWLGEFVSSPAHH